MNTSRFFSALIVATLTVGISGGTADAAEGKVIESTLGNHYCETKNPWQLKWCGDKGVVCGNGSGRGIWRKGQSCTINGIAGYVALVWETADSDLTAFDATSEADDSEWADDEYEEDYSDSEWDEEDTESESESYDDEEAEAELEYGECLPTERRTSNGLCVTAYAID